MNVFVTTVPITVCYGELNLLVLMDTSNFAPYVCDRAIARSMRVRKAPYCRTLIYGGSMAAGRSYRTRWTLAPVVPVWVPLTLGPNTCFIFPSFYNRPDSLVHMPLCIVPSPMFRSPREEVSEVLLFREPERLWLYCPKHGLL